MLGYVLLGVCLLMLIGIALILGSMADKLALIESDLADLKRKQETEGVPLRIGRMVPTPGEIQAARNRMDALGVAHPGGPGG